MRTELQPRRKLFSTLPVPFCRAVHNSGGENSTHRILKKNVRAIRAPKIHRGKLFSTIGRPTFHSVEAELKNCASRWKIIFRRWILGAQKKVEKTNNGIYIATRVAPREKILFHHVARRENNCPPCRAARTYFSTVILFCFHAGVDSHREFFLSNQVSSPGACRCPVCGDISGHRPNACIDTY